MEKHKKLYKSRKNSVIDGVCGGIGEYFGIDPVIIRLIWVIGFFTGGIGIIAYIIAMIIIPVAPRQEDEDVYVEFEEEKYNEDKPKSYDNDNTVRIIGIGLLVVGISMIIREYVWWFDWSLVFPIALMFIGGLLLIKRK